MNALAAQPAGRLLARLIPRLASNHDGEVIATARAIARVLRSNGLDWHDLAKAVERSAAPVAGSDEQWHRLAQCLEGLDHFTSKEKDFLRTARDLMAAGHTLSARQADWLDGLHSRLITRWRPRDA